MPQTPSAPEQQAPPKPLHELKRTKPQPEMKQPKKPEPEIKETPQPDPGDAHIGAREDQVSDTQAPSGDAFKDEPRQG